MARHQPTVYSSGWQAGSASKCFWQYTFTTRWVHVANCNAALGVAANVIKQHNSLVLA